MSEFGFAICKPGFEECLKIEMRQRYPDFRFAYSRKGFVTWRAPSNESLNTFAAQRDLCFAQIHGWSLGKVEHDNPTGFLIQLDDETLLINKKGDENPDQLTIVLPAEKWQVRIHRSQWGELDRLSAIQAAIQAEASVPSKAYFKAKEVLLIAAQLGIHFPKNEPAIDVGSAPGGASYAFLEEGYRVFGIDPAKMDERCLKHPQFEHIQSSAIQAIQTNAPPRGLVFVDMNVRPEIMMDQLREWFASTHVRYLVCTWKIPQKGLAVKIPTWKSRLLEFGFDQIAIKQLLSNAQEVTALAIKSRK